MNNLSLNFFTSSRGHFSNKEIYKYTLSDLYKKSEYIKSNSCGKIGHIKISPNEIEIGEKIEQSLYLDFQFHKVIKTIGNWTHNDNSHHIEYLKDIKTLYSNAGLSNYKYGLNLEDDFIFHTPNFDNYIGRAIGILENNPELLNIRYSRIDQPNRAREIATSKQIKDDLYSNSEEWSFNPAFIRNRDMRFISQFAYKNHLSINLHCERCFGLSANYLLSDRNDMGFYDNRFAIISEPIVEHIGWQEAIKKYNILP